MSRLKLKKYLDEMEKSDIIELLLDSYDRSKDTKEYLEYFLNPDEDKALEKYKSVITSEFTPRRRGPKMRIRECKRAIKDFTTLGASPEGQIKLLMYYITIVCHCISEKKHYPGSHLEYLSTCFDRALTIMEDYKLIDAYEGHILKDIEYLTGSIDSLAQSFTHIYHSHTRA